MYIECVLLNMFCLLTYAAHYLVNYKKKLLEKPRDALY